MTLGLPALVLIASAGLNLAWLVTFRKLHSRVPERPPAPLASKLTFPGWEPLRERIANWYGSHRIEAWIGLLSVAIGTVIWITSPERQAGRISTPLYGLHYVRSFQLEIAAGLATYLAIAAGMGSLLLLGIAQRRRRFSASRAGLLISALSLASLAQLAVMGFNQEPAGVLYLLAIAFFFAWAWAWQPELEKDLLQRASLSWTELGLLGLALGITALARFHKLGDIPFGIEGDEGRWTVEVVYAMVDGEHPFGTEYHLASVPTSFYMQAPFQRLFGPGLRSARMAVAFFSLVASGIAYWTFRQLTSTRIALLATLLLGVSIFDVSASRLANVESHVKLWPILAFGLMILAIRRQHRSSYLLAGLAVAIGMLTYDTVWPLVPIGLVVIGTGMLRQELRAEQRLQRLGAYLLPQLLAAPVTIAYFAGRSSYYGIRERWLEDPLGTALLHLSDLIDTVFHQTHGDFLYNRFGPLFNSLLLPWLVLGSVILLVGIKQYRLLWAVIFGALFLLPAPLLTNNPAGRVLYPGLPIAYLAIAVGLIAAYAEIQRAIGQRWRPALLAVSGIGLAYLCVLNLHIYFNEVRDFSDRQLRRELYEIARSTSRKDSLTYYPYVGQIGDPIEHEADYAIWLGYRSRAKEVTRSLPYTALPVAELMGHLAANALRYQYIEVVWDAVREDEPETRAEALQELLTCYPGWRRIGGRYFDRYILTETVRAGSACVERSTP
jgi:hypothetical protein